MTPLTLMPEGDALVIGWLREHANMIALDANVAGKVPSKFVKPWVRVTLLNASRIPRSTRDHVIDYLLQFDCYAGASVDGGQDEASELSWTTRSILEALEGTVADGAAVTRVSFDTHMHGGADTDLEPARERYILIANVMMHPE